MTSENLEQVPGVVGDEDRATVTTTIEDAVSAAVEQLPPLRKWVAKRQLRRQSVRDDVYANVALALVNDERARDCCPAHSMQSLENRYGSYGAATVEVYSADWAQFLELLVEYLPQILSILMQFFGVLVLALGLCLAGSSNATACDLNPLSRAAIVVKAPAKAVSTTLVRLQSRRPLLDALTTPRPRQAVTRAGATVCGPGGCVTTPAPVAIATQPQSVLVRTVAPVQAPAVSFVQAPVAQRNAGIVLRSLRPIATTPATPAGDCAACGPVAAAVVAQYTACDPVAAPAAAVTVYQAPARPATFGESVRARGGIFRGGIFRTIFSRFGCRR